MAPLCKSRRLVPSEKHVYRIRGLAEGDKGGGAFESVSRSISDVLDRRRGA